MKTTRRFRYNHRMITGRRFLAGLTAVSLVGAGLAFSLPLRDARAGDRTVGTGMGLLGGALIGSLVGKKKNRAQNALIGGAVGGLLGHTLSGSGSQANTQPPPVQSYPASAPAASTWKNPNQKPRTTVNTWSPPTPTTRWPLPMPAPYARYVDEGGGYAGDFENDAFNDSGIYADEMSGDTYAQTLDSGAARNGSGGGGRLDTSNCQEMTYKTEVDGQQSMVPGIVCRQADGRWVIVEKP